MGEIRSKILEKLTRRSPARRSRSGRVFVVAPLLVTGLILAGTAGYILIEDYPLLDAVYMTVITLTTVGFTEVHPLSTAGRAFTASLIVVGVGTLFYALGQISEFVIDNAISGRPRMDKQIKKLKDHFILCGYGRSGQAIARRLAQAGACFLAIESDPGKIERLASDGCLYISGNATEDDVLIQAGVERARGLVVALTSDADNLYVTLTVREINPNIYIVARVESEGSGPKLLRAGADKVINPYDSSGTRMANILLNPTVHAFMETMLLDPDVDLRIGELQVAQDSELGGVTLGDSKIRKDHDIMVVALKTAGGDIKFNPNARTRISPGDMIIALGSKTDLEFLERICVGRR